MPRVPGSVPAHSKPVYDAFLADLEASGRATLLAADAARRFLVRWPDPGAWAGEPLRRRLRCDVQARPFVMFLMLHGHLRPGYDFLLRRKLPSVWRELPRSPLNPDLERFLAAAAELGFTRRTRLAIGSQVIIRLLIQTGKPLGELTEADFAGLAQACRERQRDDGTGWRHYSGAMHAARTVLFHMGVLPAVPVNP